MEVKKVHVTNTMGQDLASLSINDTTYLMFHPVMGELIASHVLVPSQSATAPGVSEPDKHALPDSCSPSRGSRKSKRLFPQVMEEISGPRPTSDPEQTVVIVKELEDKVENQYDPMEDEMC